MRAKIQRANSMADILQQLASLPLNELHLDPIIQAGSRAVDSQTAVPASSTSQACFTLFDQAVQQGFSAILIDYIIDVQDGALVKCARDWCQQTVADVQHRIDQADLTWQIQSDLKRIDAAVAALKAFNQISGSASSQLRQTSTAPQSRSVAAPPDLNQALKLHKLLKLVSWYLNQSLHVIPAAGNFASLPDWTRRVQLRHEKKPTQEPLFLEEILQKLPEAGAYPFASGMHALQAVIRTANSRPADNGHDDAQHWNMCVALLVYYLCDSGALQLDTPKGQQLCNSLCESLNISRNELALWMAAPAFDDATLVNPSQNPAQTPSCNPGKGSPDEGLTGNAVLQSACADLLAHTPTNLPTKVLKVLAGLGLNHTAMQLHYTQPGPVALTADGKVNFDDAWTAVQLRLSCGMVADALTYTRAVVSACKDEEERKAVRIQLMRGVLDAAVQPGAVRGAPIASTVVLELFCGHEEEDILVDWLLNALHEGKAVGHLLPMVMAARGKVPEALGAHHLWSNACQTNQKLANSAKDGFEVISAAVSCAAQALPLPLRRVQVEVASSGAGMGGGADLRGTDSLLSYLHSVSEPGLQKLIVSRIQGSNAAQYPTTLASSSLPLKPATGTIQSDSSSSNQGQPLPGQAALPGVGNVTGVTAGGSAAFVNALGTLSGNSLLFTNGALTQQPQTTEQELNIASNGGVRTGMFEPINGQSQPPPLGSLFGVQNDNRANAPQNASRPHAAQGRALFSLSSTPMNNMGQPTAAGFETPVNKRLRPNSWLQQ